MPGLKLLLVATFTPLNHKLTLCQDNRYHTKHTSSTLSTDFMSGMPFKPFQLKEFMSAKVFSFRFSRCASNPTPEEIEECARCAILLNFNRFNIVPILYRGVQNIALLTVIWDEWWCAITCLKVQGLWKWPCLWYPSMSGMPLVPSQLSGRPYFRHASGTSLRQACLWHTICGWTLFQAFLLAHTQLICHACL